MADTLKDAIANTKSLRRTLRSLLAVADVVDGIANLESTVQNLKDRVKEEEVELASVKALIVLAEVDRQSVHESLVRAKEDVRITEGDAARARDIAIASAMEAEKAAKVCKKEADDYYAVAKQMADKNLAQINSMIDLDREHRDLARAAYVKEAKVEQDKIDNLRSEFNKLVEGIRK